VLSLHHVDAHPDVTAALAQAKTDPDWWVRQAAMKDPYEDDE
jgi:hypothetical protein